MRVADVAATEGELGAGRPGGRPWAIQTDHLLLGMLAVRGALAVKTLRALGVPPEAGRASIQAGRARASYLGSKARPRAFTAGAG
jgi:hypothetical protein